MLYEEHNVASATYVSVFLSSIGKKVELRQKTIAQARRLKIFQNYKKMFYLLPLSPEPRRWRGGHRKTRSESSRGVKYIHFFSERVTALLRGDDDDDDDAAAASATDPPRK